MKICEKETQYDKLNSGDVFGWSWHGEPRVGMKSGEGYIHISGNLCGFHFEAVKKSEVMRSELTFYPNACISLGDPE